MKVIVEIASQQNSLYFPLLSRFKITYSKGQGTLAYCSPWGCKELDMTYWLNNRQHMCVCVCVCVYAHICFPGGASGKEPSCQCRRHKRYRFDSWVGKISWRRELLPTSVFLPGESHGQRSLAGYSPWGCKELDKMHTYLSVCLSIYQLSDQLLCWVPVV